MNEITHEIAIGQVYKDTRTGDRIELIYIDDNIYVAQNTDTSHRLGKRAEFDKYLGAERYSYEPEAEQFAQTEELATDAAEEIAFEELDSIGESGAENLREKGIVTRNDVKKASDEEILDTSWVGQAGLDSIRDSI